ncbi:MAG: RagB/SusD family nutrient uptake outer membrane protein, partial [Bacteroidales bacterium]|nr:RagB/SusD family nutrient uptake outer membrane protein [Bacteroidales bacterium]
DGATTASWGCTLFLIASTHDANLPAWGTSEAWGGNRALPELVDKFFPGKNAPLEASPATMQVAAGDDRALFESVGRSYSIDKVGTFTNGFAVTKFNNIYSDGGSSHDAQYVDTDFFFFRAAEAYLSYAEADARLNGGKATDDGLDKINAVRARAHASRLPSADLATICDEWSREFYFEGRRRSDLIRFGYYGGNTSYTWTFKGSSDIYAGTPFPAFRNIFAIPTTDIVANSNLVQNAGY